MNFIVLNKGNDKIDTSTIIGKLIITVLSDIVEFEADMFKERQLEGSAMVGMYNGRAKHFTEKHKGLQYEIKLYNNRNENKLTVNVISEITNISRAILYRTVKA